MIKKQNKLLHKKSLTIFVRKGMKKNGCVARRQKQPTLPFHLHVHPPSCCLPGSCSPTLPLATLLVCVRWPSLSLPPWFAFVLVWTPYPCLYPFTVYWVVCPHPCLSVLVYPHSYPFMVFGAGLCPCSSMLMWAGLPLFVHGVGCLPLFMPIHGVLGCSTLVHPCPCLYGLACQPSFTLVLPSFMPVQGVLGSSALVHAHLHICPTSWASGSSVLALLFVCSISLVSIVKT